MSNSYAPPAVDEHGRYPWEAAAAAAAAGNPAQPSAAYGVDPNAFDPNVYGYAQPQRQQGRKIECTICQRSGHTYQNCPNKKAVGQDTVYISNLPATVTEKDLIAHFGSIGIIATDRKTKGPKVKLYRGSNGQPKGDALVSYADEATAPAAIEWFHNKEFQGNTLSVVMAYGQSVPEASAPPSAPAAPSYSSSGYGAQRGYGDRQHSAHGSQPPVSHHGEFSHGSAGGSGGQPRKEGDWDCPTCSNVNWAKRDQCHKCRTPRPAHLSAGPSFGSGGPPVTRPGDWQCSMCSNVNFSHRDKCNKCGSGKPGVVQENRTGRGGGFNERDAGDRERRERREQAERGEEYDEFGRKKRSVGGDRAYSESGNGDSRHGHDSRNYRDSRDSRDSRDTRDSRDNRDSRDDRRDYNSRRSRSRSPRDRNYGSSERGRH